MPRKPKVGLAEKQVVYEIMKDLAERKKTLVYLGLSQRFFKRTGIWIAPRAWGRLLGEVNDRLHGRGKPGISAVIKNKKLGMPGENYFGLPNTPAKQSRAAWKRALTEVFNTSWPTSLFVPAP